MVMPGASGAALLLLKLEITVSIGHCLHGAHRGGGRGESREPLFKSDGCPAANPSVLHAFPGADRDRASHLEQNRPDGPHKLLNIRREKPANGPDAEGVHLREFAGINDESALAEFQVEGS